MPLPPSRFTIACVIDENPRFYVELVLWVICARRCLPPDRFQTVVYSVGVEPVDIGSWLHANGIEVRRTKTVVEGAPRCNKLAPFFDDHSTDCTIVCDVDLFFVGDLSDLLCSWRFRAPPNNHSVPPRRIFNSLLAARGLEGGYRPGVALFRGEEGIRETHINNISSGVVVAPAARSGEFTRLWKKRAIWLVEHSHLLESWTFHVNQVSFALTMEELREDVELLPPQVNTILHLLSEIATVRAFHLTTGHIPQFPQRFNPNKTLNPDGVAPGVVEAIKRLNECIGEAVATMVQMPSTRDHLDKFLNPQWRR
jgi:hypothetical protein